LPGRSTVPVLLPAKSLHGVVQGKLPLNTNKQYQTVVNNKIITTLAQQFHQTPQNLKSATMHSLQLAFEIFQNRDGYFEKVSEDKYPKTIIKGQVLFIFLAAFVYGVIMGSYNGPAQAISSGIKLSLLIFLTLLICFPAFYIVQLLLGSKMKLKQLIIMLLGGFVMLTTILVAFAPIVLFFQLSRSPYSFLQLLHFFVFVFAGIWSMRVVVETLKTACEKKNIYPKIGLTIFRLWIFILAFVGIQLSWNLRPFIGTREIPFEIFRDTTQNNIYATLIGAIGRLLDAN
jgi:hypothetical protein